MRTDTYKKGLGRPGLATRKVSIMFLLVMLGVWSAPVQGHAQGMLSVIKQQTEADTPSSQPKEPQATAEEAPGSVSALEIYAERAIKARDVARQIFAAIPELDDAVEKTLRAKGENGSLSWIGRTLLGILLGIGIGLLAYRLVIMWGRKQFAHLYSGTVQQRADKIAYLFLRSLVMTAGVVVFAAVAGLIMLFINRGSSATLQTAAIALSCMTLFMLVRIVFFNLLSPTLPGLRLIAMDDHHAKGLYRSLIIGAGLAAFLFALVNCIEKLGLPDDARKLVFIGSSLISALILSGIALVYRNVIGSLIRGKKGEGAVIWRRVLSRSWHILAAAYFMFAWLVTAVRTLLGLSDATGLVVAPLQTLLFAVIVYGLLILLIDKVLLPRLDTPAAQAQIAEDIKRAELSGGEGEEVDSRETAAQARAEAAEREAHRTPFRTLLDHGASLLVIFSGLALLVRLWGISIVNSTSAVGTMIEIPLIAFIGYMAYRAVEIAIDSKMAKEGPGEGKDEEAEIGGPGESRISTLLPIFRNFLLITIVAISGMVALSELGVNIAPLFAGAGVVGLAVGFGAQTLIRDIFSGAFYLIDDAFRKGEYIDIGSAKGVVEKISVRSMQLRHHRGALTTVPFGEIQHVQNFARDWAIMKLAFRVTYDTDVEKMRKIIKKFGQELLNDEYYGPMFLQPLKSQGIMSMEDSAMIARVKFMTKPGKQFEVRKVVYAGLQERFEQGGIKFAHKQVTVRVAPGEGDSDEPHSHGQDATKQAAAGAAAAGVLENQ